jgi:hypothetical protein
MVLVDNVQLATELSLVLLDDKYDLEISRVVPKSIEILIIETHGSNCFKFQTVIDGRSDKRYEIIATSEMNARAELRSLLIADYCVPIEYREEYLEAYDYYESLIDYYKVNRKYTLRPLTEEETYKL